MSLEMEVGELKGTMAGVEKDIAEMKVQNKTIEHKLDKVVSHFEQATSEVKGGWKVLTGLAAASGVVGAVVTKVIHAMTILPK